MPLQQRKDKSAEGSESLNKEKLLAGTEADTLTGATDSAQTVRQRAEKIFAERSAQFLRVPTAEERAATHHELQVHQIELEIQNEELRRIQKEVQASRALYLNLYDMAPVGYLTLNEEGLILRANSTAAKMIGVARSALINQPLSSYVLPEDQDTNYHALKQLFGPGGPQVWEVRMVGEAGNTFWSCLEATTALDVDGTPVCRAVVSDITKRKISEGELRGTFHLHSDHAAGALTAATNSIQSKSERVREQAEKIIAERNAQVPENLETLTLEKRVTAHYELRVHQIELEIQNEELRRIYEEVQASRALYLNLYDMAPVGYLTLNREGLILGANSTVAKMIGVARSALINQPLSSFVFPEDQDTNYHAFKQLFGTAGPQVWEVRMVAEAGNAFWTCLEATIAPDVDGIAMCHAVVSDISKRKISEENLARALAEKRALLQEIHHRVKNNLAIVSSLLSLQANTIDNQETVATLEDAERRVKAMSMIHEQLYSHIDMSSIDFAVYGRDLAVRLFSTYSQNATITYRLELAPITLAIAQAIPLGLILNELITNALKYAYPDGNGEILIQLSSEGHQVCMTVSDNGAGLPANFDLQTSKSLGLTIIQALTDQLQGELEIGTPPGACFIVRFSMQPEDARAASA
jgi:PAS domain S-box-containing protein